MHPWDVGWRAPVDGAGCTWWVSFSLGSPRRGQDDLIPTDGDPMKRLALVSLLATAAVGVHAETYVDNARVRSVDPQYESVNVPREECSSQWVNERRPVGRRDYGGGLFCGGAGAPVGKPGGGGRGPGGAPAARAGGGALAWADHGQPGPWGGCGSEARE